MQGRAKRWRWREGDIVFCFFFFFFFFFLSSATLPIVKSVMKEFWRVLEGPWQEAWRHFWRRNQRSESDYCKWKKQENNRPRSWKSSPHRSPSFTMTIGWICLTRQLMEDTSDLQSFQMIHFFEMSREEMFSTKTTIQAASTLLKTLLLSRFLGMSRKLVSRGARWCQSLVIILDRGRQKRHKTILQLAIWENNGKGKNNGLSPCQMNPFEP